MDTEYLKEYIAFSKTLSYAKAADELFISQPTLRAHIRTIEEEIGAPLTMRLGNQIALSPAGKYFLRRAHDITTLVEESISESHRLADESAMLLIGFLEYPWIEDFFVKARERFSLNHPEKKLDLHLSPKMHANIEAVLQEEVDITVFPFTRPLEHARERIPLNLPESISNLYLGAFECKFWMAKSNTLFDKPTITAQDLAGSSLLLGNTPNMIEAGPKFVEYFANAGAHIDLDNQPFSSYVDYFLFDAPATFGIILEGHRFEQQSREGFRIFSVEDFTIFSDLFILYNKARFNKCGIEYLSELEKSIREQDSLPSDA